MRKLYAFLVMAAVVLGTGGVWAQSASVFGGDKLYSADLFSTPSMQAVMAKKIELLDIGTRDGGGFMPDPSKINNSLALLSRFQQLKVDNQLPEPFEPFNPRPKFPLPKDICIYAICTCQPGGPCLTDKTGQWSDPLRDVSPAHKAGMKNSFDAFLRSYHSANQSLLAGTQISNDVLQAALAKHNACVSNAAAC